MNDCSQFRCHRYKYLLAHQDRRGGWTVEPIDAVNMQAVKERMLKRRCNFRIMRDTLYPCSLIQANGERLPTYYPSDRALLFDHIHVQPPAAVPPTRVPLVINDGGRAAAGYKGTTGDCVVRAIAIACEKPYSEVYDRLSALRILHATTKRDRVARSLRAKGSSPRNGNPRKVYEKLLVEYGWKFVPTMSFGSGCKVHLRPDELPPGRIIARVSKHLVAVVDGVIHDTFDCSRQGTRCVYGYYMQPAPGGTGHQTQA